MVISCLLLLWTRNVKVYTFPEAPCINPMSTYSTGIKQEDCLTNIRLKCKSIIYIYIYMTKLDLQNCSTSRAKGHRESSYSLHFSYMTGIVSNIVIILSNIQIYLLLENLYVKVKKLYSSG